MDPWSTEDDVVGRRGIDDLKLVRNVQTLCEDYQRYLSKGLLRFAAETYQRCNLTDDLAIRDLHAIQSVSKYDVSGTPIINKITFN